jgi:CheY-like chemotaxis protein
MIYWLSILLVILAGLTAGTLLWGIRRHSIVKRLQEGIDALSQGRTPPVLQRSPEDLEHVLGAFDQLATQILEERKTNSLAERSRDMEVVLERLVSMMRHPLVAAQSYASLVKQAPEIPPTGDTHELVQRLYHQVSGLVRLFEVSTNASELRAAISGLERDIVGGAIDVKPTRTALIVDDENTWSRQLVEALRPLRLQVLLAPGADAAVIMARAVRPRAIVVNVGRSDGLGWRALAPLRRERSLATVPVILYSLQSDQQQGWIAPVNDVWFWPLLNNDDGRIVRHAIRNTAWHYTLHGEAELATELSRWLAVAGMVTEPPNQPGIFELPGCVTLRISDANNAPIESILVVPQRILPQQVAPLTDEIARCTLRSPLKADQLQESLVQRLRPVAELVTLDTP